MLVLSLHEVFLEIAFSVLFISFFRSLVKKRRPRAPLPPGPKPLPIIGNLLDVPSSFEWVEYMKWSEKYNSDIVSFTVAGTSVVVLNSQEVVSDLMEKRGKIYSSRPPATMLVDLMGWSWAFVFQPYGPRWQEHRKLFVKEFNPTQPERYQPHEIKSVTTFLENLIHSPDNFSAHLRHMAGALIMSATYGIDVAARDDPYVKNADGALDGIVHAAVPGTFWVDYLPILKYIPPWFPGASFRRKAEIWKGYSMALLTKPYQEVKKQMENGTCKPSFVYHCLQNIDSDGDIDRQEDIIQGTAGTMYIGGTDTTVAALNSFFLAMVLHPDVQKKAQEELDRVIGFGRLPSHSDEADLPYMTAVMYEVLRTQPVTPIGIPHYTTEDDYYRGYYIPKDSVVISNIWAILHDKDMYPDPDTFNPSRWLTPDGTGINTDLRDIMANFGFGRRVCPGAHMALSSTWMTMASVLMTFNISEKVTENGEIIKLTGEYESSLQNRPVPFECSIKARTPEHEKFISSLIALA